MKLIDADAINFEDMCDCCPSADCGDCPGPKGFASWLKKQPTAYDPDKIVEQLKQLSIGTVLCSMSRLTTEKDVKDMSMYELALNSCYAKDKKARYRDYETDIDARDFARKLMVSYGVWKSMQEYGLDADNELVDDDIFDESIFDSLQYGADTIEGLIALFYRSIWAMADLRTRLKRYEDLEEQGRLIVTPETGIGDLSDGYHTFNELYHHRAVLFSVICNAFKSCAWKSKQHSDGTMYDGMFIVGIDTPEGSATYHYDIEPYWNMFNVKELDKAPEWDGHTPDDAINRIAGLSKSNRLTELPCAVGDTVWEINEYAKGFKIRPMTVLSIKLKENKGLVYTTYSDEHDDFVRGYGFDDFGEILFLTKEEAEAKLAELKGE